nr:hypothetical protein [Cytophagales bacterium]
MKNQLRILVLLLLATGVASAQKRESGNLTFENVPVPDPQLAARLDQYENIRTASFVGWDTKTDGLLISTRFGNVPQIHHVARPGGYRQQLTFEREPVGNGSVCPDSSKHGFLFGMDAGGNENYQLYFFDRATGRKRLLTDGKSRNGGGVWSKKGEKFAYTSNRRSPGDLDIYVASLENPSDARMVFQGKGGGWGINDWAADDRQLLVSEYLSVNESKLYLLDIASGKLEQINPSAKQIAYGAERFSKDGKGVFFVSDEDSEFQQLRFYDFATKKIANLTAAINWDVQNFHQSEDGKHLVFSTNENGYTRVYLMDVPSRQYRPIPNLPDGIIGGLRFNRDNRRIAISVFASQVPGDVFVLDIQTNAVERWTFGETGGLNAASFVEATLVQFPTFDKVNGKPRLIPAFLYLPKNATGKVPVLIDIHGGPEGQSQPGFGAQTQFWAGELKVAVLRPNVRGSTGYGKTYAKLDNGVLRENSVKDIGALLDWIAKQPN